MKKRIKEKKRNEEWCDKVIRWSNIAMLIGSIVLFILSAIKLLEFLI